MQWLNYQHLHYFWLAAREGGISRAARQLRLTHTTVSEQIRALEEAMGEPLFKKEGRGVALTEMGGVVYGYAEDIFSLGRELMETVQGRPTGRPTRLVVGIAEVVPKLIAKRILDPALSEPDQIKLVCREDKLERLLASLAAHELDVVISDSPLPPGAAIHAFNHLLGESGISIMGSKSLASRYRKNFPASLDGAPFLMPMENTALRRGLDQWFEAENLHPVVRAEFEDSALLKVFGQDGVGLVPAPSIMEASVARQYDLQLVGRIDAVREQFYAISVERKIRHPAVLAICQAARAEFAKIIE
jgi:LysR family transcriptional regulator, transcriptional activator of nhaA